MTYTPTAEVRNEHHGAVSVGYHDPNALTRDQLIRLHAAQLAAQRLGAAPDVHTSFAVDELLHAASAIARWITAAPVTPEER